MPEYIKFFYVIFLCDQNLRKWSTSFSLFMRMNEAIKTGPTKIGEDPFLQVRQIL